MVSHAPLAVFVILAPQLLPAGRSTVTLSPSTSWRLHDFRLSMEAARDSVDSTRFSDPRVLRQQRSLYEATLQFAGKVLAANATSRVETDAFTYTLLDSINHNLYLAAQAQIDRYAPQLPAPTRRPHASSQHGRRHGQHHRVSLREGAGFPPCDDPRIPHGAPGQHRDPGTRVALAPPRAQCSRTVRARDPALSGECNATFSGHPPRRNPLAAAAGLPLALWLGLSSRRRLLLLPAASNAHLPSFHTSQFFERYYSKRPYLNERFWTAEHMTSEAYAKSLASTHVTYVLPKAPLSGIPGSGGGGGGEGGCHPCRATAPSPHPVRP